VKKAESSDDDDSSDEEPPAKKAPAKKAASPKVAAKKPPAKKEESSDDDDSSDEEPPAKKAPAKKAASPKVAAKKPPAKKEESSDDDDSSDEEPPAKKKPAPKRKADDSSDEDEDEEPPAKKGKAEESKKRKADDWDTPSKAAKVESTWVVLKNLAWAATDDDITTFFADVAVPKQIMIGKFPDGGEREGICSVEFSSSEEAEQAAGLNETELCWRTVYISVNQPRKQWNDAPSEKPEGCTTVFVGKLSDDVWDEDGAQLTEFFKDCGSVSNVRFMTDRETQAFKGCAWVDFEDTDATDEAVKLNGSELCGRNIKVDFAAPRAPRTDWGGDSWGGDSKGKGKGKGKGKDGKGKGKGKDGKGKSKGKGKDGKGKSKGKGKPEFSGSKATFEEDSD